MIKFTRSAVLFFFLSVIFSQTFCSDSPVIDNAVIPSISITILDNGIENRTILPNISMGINSFRVTGTGPNGNSFTKDISDNSLEVYSLASGSWTVSVDAYNGVLVSGSVSGVQIGSGSSAVNVVPGQSASCNIGVVPLEGNGIFRLSASWTAGVELADDNPITVSFRKAGTTGEIGLTGLTITAASKTISCSDTTISSGYYTLNIIVKYKDNREAGLTEIVRIVNGGITLANLTINISNEGSIQVVITPHMNDPIEPQIAINGSHTTVTATVSGLIGSLLYTWYIDGVYNSTTTTNSGTATLTVPAGLSSGNHRIDVTVFTTDYSQGGSASIEFTVVQ
jgi:hypothetical protein